MRPSPILQPRDSQIVNSQQLQHVASSSRRREDQSPLPFPAAQVFHKREHCPIQVIREDLNIENDRQDAVESFFRIADVRCGYETLIKNQVLFLSSKFV
ncbi:hypothetical protein O181_098074 [Austropuccinia psidii MF-1]|uniref:Uncharacterized protein n=1 Tax=Austropuccinia psidii MF-1 TaxID=1389203 RepID=A0A9Q3JA36_9BASI|nr:hypothetical protein [Austropuccinia psidii MF-1]